MMKIFGLIVFIFLLIQNSYSQDTIWRKKVIDENLTVSFPGTVSQMDTLLRKNGEHFRFRTYKSESEFSTLAVLITPNETKINVDNEESLSKALTEMAKGSLNAMTQKGMTCQVSDTIIDDIPSKKLMCYAGGLSTLSNYIFLVNDKMYVFQTAFFNSYEIEAQSSKLNFFLKSIHFNKASIKEQRFGSKAESIGYNIGRMIIPLLIIVGVIVYVVRKL